LEEWEVRQKSEGRRTGRKKPRPEVGAWPSGDTNPPTCLPSSEHGKHPKVMRGNPGKEAWAGFGGYCSIIFGDINKVFNNAMTRHR
jgi:hypothetical protein